MKHLPGDITAWPLGMLGKDPRTNTSRTYGKSIVDFEIKKMAAVIRKELKKELP
jgi:hypothetical protein